MSEVAHIEGPQRKKLLQVIGDRYGIEPAKLLEALKATAFKLQSGQVSNEQMVALLVVADQYGLNPFTREIFAFPSKAGIVPVVGVDGWSRIINTNEAFDGIDFSQSENMVESTEHKPCPEWIECAMHRKDRAHPIVVREYFDECYQPPKGNYSGPWQSHPKRFLRHKAMIQAARICFGFVGIYDQDEAERFIDITPKRTGVMADVIEQSPLVFNEEERQQLAEDIDNCFTLDPAEGLVLEEPETFDEKWDLVCSDADLKIAVWDMIGSKVRTYISAMEKG